MSVPAEPLLQVDDLQVEFGELDSPARVVRGVSLRVDRGETVGIVGESGSGKSVFARTVMGLTGTDSSARVQGRVLLGGIELTGMKPREARRYWGNDVAMVFQDPLASLNPVKTIGSHFSVPLRLHLGMTRKAARERSVELLDLVGIPDPRGRLQQYPHELSGGMRQRVMLALAVSCEPRLLIADEPTTALDVTVQRQVLDLIDRLSVQLEMATLLITHDLAVVAGRADRIAVMYAGRIVEQATTTDLFERQQHPYSQALLAAIPTMGESRGRRLRAIGGRPPDPRMPDEGCQFRSRCEHAIDVCATRRPPLASTTGGDDHLVACHRPITAEPVPVGAPEVRP